MAKVSQTLSILKPDVTRRNLTGKVNAMIESAGLRIVAQKRIQLTQAQAQTFYEVHKERPFFKDLVNFMCQGPIIVQVLEGRDVVIHYRKLMGATNPEQADTGTIRKTVGESIEANSVHGSDSEENAEREIAFFYAGIEILS